jgi:hypothetical protein
MKPLRQCAGAGQDDMKTRRIPSRRCEVAQSLDRFFTQSLRFIEYQHNSIAIPDACGKFGDSLRTRGCGQPGRMNTELFEDQFQESVPPNSTIIYARGFYIFTRA